MNKNPISDITGIFNKLAPAQKMLLAGVSVTTVVLLIVLLSLLNEPNYSTLFTHMAPEDANKVVEELNSKKIPFKLEANGETIKVPKENVYELRLNLAAKGIPTSGIVGYEIFDKSTIGMSEFMQKLNYRRALEGELARTIMQQEQIEAARVHIVFPKKAVFKEDEIEPTASVVIKEKGGKKLNRKNIEAIQHLIASSIEGMEPGNVAILDTKGLLLSNNQEEDPNSGNVSYQYEMKRTVEKYLVDKAQKILDNVLGAGNAIVQVDALLDFNQVEKTMEMYDPETQVIVSEQSVKTQNIGHNIADSTANISENSTINYETGKTIQRVVEESGSIRKLSIATVINHVRKRVKKGGEVQIEYEPRSQEELDKLTSLIKSAVGYSPERGDVISVESIPFEPGFEQDFKIPAVGEREFFDINNLDKLINLIIIVFAIIASLFILKGLLKRVKDEKILIGNVSATPTGELTLDSSNPLVQLSAAHRDLESGALMPKKKKLTPLGDLEDEITDEAAMKKMQHERITEYVSHNPVDAAKLINTWLHEDEYS